jgi:MFS family permease
MSAIIGRFGTARVAVLAFASLVAGYAVFLRVGIQPDYPSVILPAVILIGVAFGLGFSALSLAATDGVADAEQGLAASLFQTSFQVGGAIVLAVVTAVVEAGGASRITSAQATLGAYRPALALITVVSALGAVAALTGLRSARRDVRLAPIPVPAPVSVPVADPDPAVVTDAALAVEADLITGTAREVEEDCTTPLCL